MPFILETSRLGKMEKTKSFTINLTETKRSGEFKCPQCGVKISPDDKSEVIYRILKTVMNGDCLEKLILQCNKCGSRIHLVGFNVLDD
jgi:predicted RNA-binding Zn-ribbon protein involved in translation (DUF1610 family)